MNYNVIIESEVQSQLELLKLSFEDTYGDKTGTKIFDRILSALDNLQFFEIGRNIRKDFNVDCPDNWFMLYVSKNIFIFSRTEQSVTILKMYNEKQDYIFDLFGKEMRSQESKEFWGE